MICSNHHSQEHCRFISSSVVLLFHYAYTRIISVNLMALLGVDGTVLALSYRNSICDPTIAELPFKRALHLVSRCYPRRAEH